MRRTVTITFGPLIAGLLLVTAAFGLEPGRGGTSVVTMPGGGAALVVSTGTGHGDCPVRGTVVTCHDGSSVSSADTAAGCLTSVGGAYCTLVGVDDQDQPADVDNPEIVEAMGTEVDITCTKGALQSTVVTVSDGDGNGECTSTLGPDGRITSATCTKDGRECAAMDCTHGCTSAGRGCSCKVKFRLTTPRQPAPTPPQ
jgi:hypothetical protein